MVLQTKSDNSTVHHALQSCLIRMALQNKSDNSNGHALKWSNFRLKLSFWRCLSQKRTHFHANFTGNEHLRENRKFSRNKISWKFAHFHIIFAFRENGKNHFRFNPISVWELFFCSLWKGCCEDGKLLLQM
jgi:hypothetical protein